MRPAPLISQCCHEPPLTASAPLPTLLPASHRRPNPSPGQLQKDACMRVIDLTLPIAGPFTFIAAPLPFVGSDGSPVRAIALVEQ